MAILNMVRDYEQIAKFQLGRYVGMKGPGLVWVIPIIQAGTKVDLREQYFDVPPQRNITRDNAGVDVDFVVYLRVMEPERTVLEVRDYLGAARQLATTTLRAVIGEMNLDEVLSRRDDINDEMQVKLDQVTNRWGVKVTAVEIREIEPPPTIAEAMTRQMSAERTRRAQITESEGSRDAQINIAEGERRAAILEAEGEKQARSSAPKVTAKPKSSKRRVTPTPSTQSTPPPRSRTATLWASNIWKPCATWPTATAPSGSSPWS